MITSTIVKVGIADVKVANAPHLLKTSGLGSCVGVVIYDLKLKVAGLAHIMLPDSTASKRENRNGMKYADTGIDLLLELLIKQGVNKHSLKAKLAGGAHMFAFRSDNQMLRIGERNVEAVILKLNQLNIPILAQDVGGNKGRTIEFDPDTGLLSIKTVNSEMKYI